MNGRGSKQGARRGQAVSRGGEEVRESYSSAAARAGAGAATKSLQREEEEGEEVDEGRDGRRRPRADGGGPVEQ